MVGDIVLSRLLPHKGSSGFCFPGKLNSEMSEVKSNVALDIETSQQI